MGMVDRPEGLLRPDRALRVLWAHLRGAAPAPATGMAPTGGAREQGWAGGQQAKNGQLAKGVEAIELEQNEVGRWSHRI
jgi:hypothetical protein